MSVVKVNLNPYEHMVFNFNAMTVKRIVTGTFYGQDERHHVADTWRLKDDPKDGLCFVVRGEKKEYLVKVTDRFCRGPESTILAIMRGYTDYKFEQDVLR